jgi:hypothetical protein
MKVKIINGDIETFPYSFRTLKKDNPNTSFPSSMTDEDFEAWGVYNVTVSTPPEVAHNQRAETNDAPTLIEGVWTLGWTVRNLTADEIALSSELVRGERNELLANSDWTQVNDSALDDSTKISWATYRTALRNISTQEGFPTNVTWPTAP